jgi:hypothetical protein
VTASPHVYRVTVRGPFDQLTDAQRANLLAAADDHDVTRGGFTRRRSGSS